MKYYFLFLISISIFGVVNAQTNEEKLEKLQQQLDEIQINNGNEDDVDARKINQNIEALEGILKKRDSLNYQISILKTELLLAQAKLKSCQGDNSEYASADCNKVTELNSIYFDFNSYHITNEQSNKLDKLYSQYNPKLLNGKKLLIIGYTDAIGSSSYNMKLSEKRAKAVRDALINKGIENSKIVLDFRGESDLFDAEESKKSELNRRVVVLVF